VTLPAWVEGYRGRPFRRGSDGPDDYDCYGLVRAVLRDVFDASTPTLDGIHTLGTRERLRIALDSSDSPWRECDGSLPGDVLAFRERELHVGVVVAPGWMLHALEESRTTTARFDRFPWLALRIGAYRHRDVKQAPTLRP